MKINTKTNSNYTKVLAACNYCAEVFVLAIRKDNVNDYAPQQCPICNGFIEPGRDILMQRTKGDLLIPEIKPMEVIKK